MQPAANSLFSLPPMRRLLDEEWAMAMRDAPMLAGGPALSVTAACGTARAPLPGRPGSVHLQVSGDALAGDVRCMADALPWAAASFDLVIVRHATDLLADGALEKEIARVLAPGGTLLLFGLNPLSPWRLWWSRRLVSGEPRPRSRGPARMRERLGLLGLDTCKPRWLGGSWPREQASFDDVGGDGARWHAAWMLRADKHAIAVRPLLLPAAKKVASPMSPALAPRPSMRQCA